MSILQDLLSLNQPSPEPIVENEELDADTAVSMGGELEDIHQQISKLMGEARHIVRQLPRYMRGSAESYWIPHIMIALGGEHEWTTARHESTMQKTIDELHEYGKGEGDEDEHSHHED